ncbi:MAG TPA: hypothetical protein VI479_07325 [Blastocatellia bacterium]
MTALERARAEARAFMEQIEAAERAFCRAWWDSGLRKASVGELLEYAENAGLPITGKTVRARQISLGRWLGSSVNSPIAGDGYVYRIEPAKKRDGYTQWEISVEPEQ